MRSSIRRPALTAGSLMAAAALVATGLVSGPAGAATGVKVSPTNGPIGTTIKVSGSCGSNAAGGTWLPSRIGLYYSDAFEFADVKAVFAESTARTNRTTGRFSGTIKVPARAKYERAGETPAMPGGEVTRQVSGKIGVQVRCQSTDTPNPLSTAHLDDVFTVADGAKKLKVTKKPKAKGKAKVGKKLRATKGTWKPKPESFAYQWKRGKKDIAGATKKKYKVRKKDAGKKLRVVVTGERDGYTTRSATSKKVKIKAGSKKTKASKAKAKAKAKTKAKRSDRREERRERLQERREQRRR